LASIESKEIEMTDEKKRVKVKASIYWCFHNKVNEMSGDYQLNLCNLSEAAVEAFEEMGITVQTGEGKKEDMGKYITCKSKKPIKVFDADGDEITESIGNGSKGKAIVGSYDWTFKNKKGTSASLGKLVITDLVEYASAGGDLADDEDVL
jgi:hypothetical protein